MHVFTHEPPLSHCSWSSSEFGPLAAGRRAGNAWVVWSGRVVVRSHPGGKMARSFNQWPSCGCGHFKGSILRRSAYHMKMILTSISWNNFWGSPEIICFFRDCFLPILSLEASQRPGLWPTESLVRSRWVWQLWVLQTSGGRCDMIIMILVPTPDSVYDKFCLKLDPPIQKLG